jgi:hypothetical protein
MRHENGITRDFRFVEMTPRHPEVSIPKFDLGGGLIRSHGIPKITPNLFFLF